jgi:Histidine phosphatase superfamily (branch 2)
VVLCWKRSSKYDSGAGLRYFIIFLLICSLPDRFDLLIARTDNMTDMRYMINMDYSADLPITSMGRRIRTRLYFTSESHLHTLVNVLRFGGCEGQKSILSQRGLRIINEAPELCYLTQIIIRLFEDTRRHVEDPRRYRVEILFSPGATATPLHIDELDRDADSSRFDTSGLEFIGREGLTCKEVEDFFSSAIIAGQIDESEFSLSPNMRESPKKPKGKKSKSKDVTQTNENVAVPRTVTVTTNKEAAKEKNTDAPKSIEKAPIMSPTTGVVVPKGNSMDKRSKAVEPPILKESTLVTTTKVEVESEAKVRDDAKEKSGDAKEELPRKIRALSYVKEEDEEDEEDEEARVERLARSLALKYFWRSIGVFSFVVGVSCLVLAMNVHTGPSSRRRWSRR